MQAGSDWVQPLDLKAVETLRNIMGGLTGTRATRPAVTTATRATSTGTTVSGGACTTTSSEANYPPLPYPPIPARPTASLRASAPTLVISVPAPPVFAPAPVIPAFVSVVSGSNVRDSTPASPRSQYSMPPLPLNKQQSLTPELEPEPEPKICRV